MIRRPPRSTLDRSSAASDVYKRQGKTYSTEEKIIAYEIFNEPNLPKDIKAINSYVNTCLLYTSPSPRDRTRSRMPSSA